MLKHCIVDCRIHNDLVDSEKLQATLTDETLNKACDLKRALEMVSLLEAQLKEMNPNLDSIAEYIFFLFLLEDFLACLFLILVKRFSGLIVNVVSYFCEMYLPL